jgi:hypothetical protein
MTTQEHLQKIQAKCKQLVSIYDNAEPHTPLPAVAGWRSTIAAIETLLACYPDGNIAARSFNAQHMAQTIIAAWPEELL